MGRRVNFTVTEKNIFIDLMNKPNYISVIECKKTDSKSLESKSTAWKELCAEFNSASSYCFRSVEQLQLLWKNYKARTKKRAAVIRRERAKTGGGLPPTVEKDPNLDKVEAMIPSQVQPLANLFDDDSALDINTAVTHNETEDYTLTVVEITDDSGQFCLSTLVCIRYALTVHWCKFKLQIYSLLGTIIHFEH
ncbi:unnamed protein product [Clavelina lepadiformis]|uniref:Myb/SANT-like DNA-binding domain-containing protein n=1 Tax=Clavelina lepadiformis TaxID=159417 RepID=A0ABP0GFJ8_CLALP